ncbi:MAG: hypothetical protein DRG58_09125 [Deltaproteobacteria bacterium]|nr:MAG: hypothetical protein DRG58_09125 [Deltaproteobacteria bacterium]
MSLNLTPGDGRFAAWAAAWHESSSSYGRGWADAWADGLESGLLMTNDLGQYVVDNDPFAPAWETPGWIGDNFSITCQVVPAPYTLGLLGSGCLAY